MPAESYFHFDVRFARSSEMTEAAVRELVERHGFSLANLSHRLEAEGRVRRNTMVLRTLRPAQVSELAQTLERNEAVLEFRIAPAD